MLFSKYPAAECGDSQGKYLGLIRFFFGVVVAVSGVIAAYHATIYGLRSDIARKADQATVENLDQRLIRIETILTERVATKNELLEMRDTINRRLAAIEAKLNLLQ